jgi:hypothetical protein
MKSLASIIDKLSPDEIETFRVFLISNSRTLKNKKLDLFNTIVEQKQAPKTLVISRQSAYQLKKRLQEQLYSFLVSQEQTRTNDQMFLEMDCHRKLYCFKILFDKGIHDHAFNLLQEITSVSEKYSLHSIYLDSINLRNTYFPLKKNRAKKNIPISGKIRKLTNSLGRNLYVNQYLTTATSVLHDTDQAFRKSLMADLIGFDISEAELVVERLLVINNKFFDLDFLSAREQLLGLLEEDSIASVDENIVGLIYIELVKSCICMNDLQSASKWLKDGEATLHKFDLFTSVILELKFIIALRNGQPESARSIILRAEQMHEVISSEVLNLKWSYYSLLLSFQERRYKEVIKAVNANPIFSNRMRNALVNVKFLEILSVFHLNDWDWLQYKIDSFRKIIGGLDDRFPRIVQTIALLKAQTGGRIVSDAEISEAISLIEQEFPWHPLSLEVARQTQWGKYCATETFAVSESEGVSAF